MPAARHGLSRSTVRAIRDEAGALGAASVARLSATHEWFRALPADQSSWVALVAHSGIGGFTAWLDSADEGLDVTADVFGTARFRHKSSVRIGRRW